jgi:hypothetical protein
MKKMKYIYTHIHKHCLYISSLSLSLSQSSIYIYINRIKKSVSMTISSILALNQAVVLLPCLLPSPSLQPYLQNLRTILRHYCPRQNRHHWVMCLPRQLPPLLILPYNPPPAVVVMVVVVLLLPNQREGLELGIRLVNPLQCLLY